MPTPHDDPQRPRLDRLERLLIWALGLPIIVIITAGLLAVVWGWGTTGRAADSAKWLATAIILLTVGGGAWAVIIRKR